MLSGYLTINSATDRAVYRFGQFSLHDLVILDQQTAGVIISISANTCKVLTNQVCPSLGQLKPLCCLML